MSTGQPAPCFLDLQVPAGSATSALQLGAWIGEIDAQPLLAGCTQNAGCSRQRSRCLKAEEQVLKAEEQEMPTGFTPLRLHGEEHYEEHWRCFKQVSTSHCLVIR